MSIDYTAPPGGTLDTAAIQAAVNAYLTVYPPGVPDHADLTDTDTDGHPATVIAGLAAVATSNSYDDLDDKPVITDGEDGAPGAPGADGDDGAPGLSAYQVAVNGGFVGNQAAWLASLIGPPGADGDDGSNGTNGTDGSNGTPGADGDDGLSAYQLAVANGFVGTLPAWLASLQGAAGTNGTNGTNGAPGAQGETGAPGTTDYLELDNLPTLGTVAGLNVAEVVRTASGSDQTHQWVGTATEYAAIGTKSSATVYIVTA